MPHLNSRGAVCFQQWSVRLLVRPSIRPSVHSFRLRLKLLVKEVFDIAEIQST